LTVIKKRKKLKLKYIDGKKYICKIIVKEKKYFTIKKLEKIF